MRYKRSMVCGYSPHPRGCFCPGSEEGIEWHIFPASAGVFPCHSRRSRCGPNIPRIRGGVSAIGRVIEVKEVYSPHPRGCFCEEPHHQGAWDIFPASAGVFLLFLIRLGTLPDIPRIRGGVSKLRPGYEGFLRYSPHPRGCFRVPYVRHLPILIFPASAGVFLVPNMKLVTIHYIPRIRGGVSLPTSYVDTTSLYSPHPRGCFQSIRLDEQGWIIFPASAGVFLVALVCVPFRFYIPRIRGGVSKKLLCLMELLRYSPHPRGCF